MVDQKPFARVSRSWALACWTPILTALVLIVHGFHPASEDGGLYIAGVYLRLDNALFPHDAEFVRAPMMYSHFAWLIASGCRLFHLPVLWMVFIAHLAIVALTLLAAARLARVCGYTWQEQVGSMALVTAWWTLPVAGTSLTIGDPYVTARSFSTMLSLFAVSFALEEWRDERGQFRPWPMVACALALTLTATMHRLMCGFACMFVLLLRARMMRRWRLWFGLIGVSSLVFAATLQQSAAPESSALLQAELSRTYWFLSHWRWYELFGLIAPLLLFGLIVRRSTNQVTRVTATASVAAGALSIAVAILFARVDPARHLVARLQPLRMFMQLYLVMAVLLGGSAVREVRAFCARRLPFIAGGMAWAAAALLLALVAAPMFAVQRGQYASSPHIEVPWRNDAQRNPWIGAFVWSREHTLPSSLFAIDGSYIEAPHNDAQTFRAWALRSVLPDQAKDGGEAAVDGALAQNWQRGEEAQTNLNDETDEERRVRLSPFGVDWVILQAAARTRLPCPYQNASVKVCRFAPRN